MAIVARDSSTLETPVLIIGAGAAGLALAVDLGRNGVPFILVEENAATCEDPRASIIDPGSMAWLRRAGLADEVRTLGLPEEACTRLYCTGFNGFEIANLDVSLRPNAESPEHAVRCNQMRLDPVLRQLASSHADAKLRARWRVESLRERGDYILADVYDLAALERRRIAAQYVVDCSGAASILREQLGLSHGDPRESECFAQLLLRLPGAERQFDRDLPAETVLVNAQGFWCTLESLDGRDLFRLRIDGEDAWDDYNAIDVAALLREIAGHEMDFQLLSRSRWRSGISLAPSWREGNFILAGDAAHQLPPSTTMGLGLALADGADLAWKLAARFAGWGSSGIIDAYDAERRLVAQRLIDALDAERKLEMERRPLEFHCDITLDTPSGRAARRILGRELEERHSRDLSRDRLAAATSYAGSPLIARELGADHPQGANLRLTHLLGGRAPHVRMPGLGSTLDLYGRGFVLLRLGQRAPEPGGLDRAFAHRGVPLSFRSFEDPKVAERHGARLVLVRPDAHVAWAGDAPPDDPLELADRVRGAG